MLITPFRCGRDMKCNLEYRIWKVRRCSEQTGYNFPDPVSRGRAENLYRKMIFNIYDSNGIPFPKVFLSITSTTSS